MTFPTQSTFVSGAPHSAWFFVDLLDDEPRAPVGTRFLVETEGLRAIAGVQQALAQIVDRLFAEPDRGNRIRGAHARAMQRGVQVTGQWDDATGNALLALEQQNEAARIDPRTGQAVTARRMTPELFALALGVWANDDDAIRGAVASLARLPNAHLRVVLPGDSQLPSWGYRPPVPHGASPNPSVRPLTQDLENMRRNASGAPGRGLSMMRGLFRR